MKEKCAFMNGRCDEPVFGHLHGTGEPICRPCLDHMIAWCYSHAEPTPGYHPVQNERTPQC